MSRLGRDIWLFAKVFVVAGSSIILFNDHILEPTDITGASMSPTLSPHYHETGKKDYILWRKWRPAEGLKRGDVVHYGNPHFPQGNAVKRVVALEGDVVLLDEKRRPYGSAYGGVEGERWDAWEGEVRVPRGCVWVEGDNWRASRDSNFYGPVSRALVLGRAVRVFGRGRGWGGQRVEGVEGKGTGVVVGGGLEGMRREAAEAEAAEAELWM